MSGSNQHPVVFEIGEREYTLVASPVPLTDDAGDPTLTLIDKKQGILFLSPECTGREAVSAAVGMYLTAWEIEQGPYKIPLEEHTHAISARIERFLHDADSTELVAERIGVATPTADKDRSSSRLLYSAMLSVVGLAALCVSAYIVFYAGNGTFGSPDQVIRTDDRASGTMLQGMSIDIVPIETPGRLVEIHPTQPGFVFGDDLGNVVFATSAIHQQPLAELNAPPYWMHISPGGQHVVTCDFTGAVTVIPLDSSSGIKVFYPEVQPTRVYTLYDGSIYCIDDISKTAWQLSGEVSRDNTISLLMPATSNRNFVAQVESHDNRETLSINDSSGAQILTRRYLDNQRILSFDVSPNHRSAGMIFSDGTMAIYIVDEQGELKLRGEVKIGNTSTAPTIQISKDGRYAWTCTDFLSRWDLAKFKTIATARHDPSFTEIVKGRYHEIDNRILFGSKGYGVIYE